MSTQNQAHDIDVARLVKEYMDGFHGHYKIPRHCNEEDALIKWLAATGPKYRAWSYYKGHPSDPHCAVQIKDPKWCTLFEIRWAHLIIGTIDRT